MYYCISNVSINQRTQISKATASIESQEGVCNNPFITPNVYTLLPINISSTE